VRENDVMLTSYPRSGNTWVRFILANLVEKTLSDPLADVQQAVPDIYTMSRRKLNNLRGRRILKSHEYFDPRYTKVIYLVRDPRDVAISYFHFLKKSGRLSSDARLQEWMPSFVEGRLNRFSNWQEHVQSWLSTRGGSPTFLLVYYEDLLKDPVQETSRLADFLGFGSTLGEDIRTALRASSPTELRNIQASEPSRAHPALVRRASAHTWRDELPRSVADQIEQAFGRTMRQLKYL
jgi:hypothetical protein